jgi:hypothetical protein
VQSIVDSDRARRIAATVGVLGQVASAYWFVLYPLLTVPSPASYLFFGSWIVLVGVALAWWRRHPWRSFMLPLVSVPIAVLILEFGKQSLGWLP